MALNQSRLRQPLPRVWKKFNSDTSSYGTLVTKRARVAVSSTSVHDPPNGLRSLIQEKGEELPFSFHTAEEKNPWVSFNYQAPIRLNAISIRNRTDLTERAAGLVLEGKLSTANEIVVVTNTMDTKLTEYAPRPTAARALHHDAVYGARDL